MVRLKHQRPLVHLFRLPQVAGRRQHFLIFVNELPIQEGLGNLGIGDLLAVLRQMPALMRNSRALMALPRSESLNCFDAARCSRTTCVAVLVTKTVSPVPVLYSDRQCQ